MKGVGGVGRGVCCVGKRAQDANVVGTLSQGLTTPLMTASSQGHLDVVLALLSAGANKTAKAYVGGGGHWKGAVKPIM